MEQPTDLITSAVGVLMDRYHYREEVAFDVLFSWAGSGDASLRDVASWLIYDADGHYYPEPHRLA